MTDMTFPARPLGLWPGTGREAATPPAGSSVPDAAGSDTGAADPAAIDGAIGGFGGGAIDGDTGQGGQGAIDPPAPDTGGRMSSEMPPAVLRTLRGSAAWVRAAAASDILGGGPHGLGDHIRNPEPASLRDHIDGIVNHPGKPGNAYFAFAFTGAQLLATVPVKAFGAGLEGIGSAGKRINLAGSHPATIAVIAATTALMILAIICT
jgi:hypothetical protein